MTNLEKLEQIVRAADEKKAHDLMAFDVSQLTPLMDYVVIMDASNESQLDAIVQGVVDKAADLGLDVKGVEGKDGKRWVLIDLIDIVVHVFYYSERSTYNLEKLWHDASMIDLSAWLEED